MHTIIDDIKAKLKLSDVLVDLGIVDSFSQNGAGLVGKHATHESTSKTSLRVYADGEKYKCFNCGEQGDLIDAIGHSLHGQGYSGEGQDLSEAIREGARLAGIPFEDSQAHSEDQTERRSIEDVLTEAASYFHSLLPEDIRRHLRDNYGFTDEFIDEKQIGFAPVKYSLIKHLKDKGFKKTPVYSCGLFGKAKDDRYYNHFRGRIVFPYWRRGKVVYFTARATGHTPKGKEGNEPAKYYKLLVHSDKQGHVSETVSNEYFIGEDSVRGAQEIIITEGVTDCLAAIQTGFAAVSPVTTRFRRADYPRAIDLCKRADRVFIVNDNEDSQAGQSGALEMARAFWDEGVEVRICTLPRQSEQDKVDLNEFLRDNDPGDLVKVLRSGQSLLDLVLANEDLEIEARMRQSAELYSKVNDPARQTIIRKDIAKKLKVGVRDVDAVIKAHASEAQADAERALKSEISNIESWPYVNHDGQLCIASANRKGPESFIAYKPIADLDAEITTQFVTELGEVSIVIEGSTMTGGPFEIEIPSESLAETKMLKRELYKNIGAHIRVHQEIHLRDALLAVSTSMRDVKKYHRVGWLDNQYLMPGHTDDPSIDIDIDDPDYPYGFTEDADIDKGVQALEELVKFRPAGSVLTMLSSMLLPPLAGRANLIGRRFILFLMGETGSRKSALAKMGMALYGPTFGLRRSNVFTKWGTGATTTSIIEGPAVHRDIPYVIDNYKPNTMRDSEERLVALINMWAEGGGRRRSNTDGTAQRRSRMHPWGVITGEEFPEVDAASTARTLLLEYDKIPSTDPRLKHLTAAQKLSPHMNAIGRQWIEWLEDEDNAPQIDELVNKWLPIFEDHYSQVINAAIPDTSNDGSIAETLALVMMCFVALQRIPALRPFLTRHKDEVDDFLHKTAVEMASESKKASEGDRYLTHLSDLLSTGRIFLTATHDTPIGDFAPRDRIVGFHGPDDDVYVLDSFLLPLIRQYTGDNLSGMKAAQIRKQLQRRGALNKVDMEGRGDKAVERTTRQARWNGAVKKMTCIKKSFLGFDADGLTEKDMAEKWVRS